MDKKIQEALEDYNLTIEMLTPEEIGLLEEEIKLKEQGIEVLDGVLSNPQIYYRKRN
jgi:hypothetical protein